MTEPTASWETITPDTARKMLETSPGNRALRRPIIVRQADDMKAGRFLENGETIKFDQQGRLRDGHHRLEAAVMAGVTIRALVVRGVSEDALRTVDGGTARKSSDRLQMEGYKDAKTLAAALSWQIRYEHAADGRLGWRSSVRFYGEDVFVALAAHPDMPLAVERSRSLRTAYGLLGGGLLAFAIYHTPNSEAFWRFLDTGIGMAELTGTHPALLLRERLITDKMGKARLLDDERAALLIKAHNAWRTGRPLKHLRWRTTGERSEPFPRWTP